MTDSSRYGLPTLHITHSYWQCLLHLLSILCALGHPLFPLGALPKTMQRHTLYGNHELMFTLAFVRPFLSTLACPRASALLLEIKPWVSPACPLGRVGGRGLACTHLLFLHCRIRSGFAGALVGLGLPLPCVFSCFPLSSCESFSRKEKKGTAVAHSVWHKDDVLGHPSSCQIKLAYLALGCRGKVCGLVAHSERHSARSTP